MRVKQRNIVVTGAASGIGRAVVELFLREGAKVLALDCNESGLDLLRGELGNAESLVCCAADVTDAGQISSALDCGLQEFGSLHGVVNSAGFDLLKPLVEMSEQELMRVLSVNLIGPTLMCKALVPLFQRGGGATIVNISSGAGLRPLENRSAYCASKAGLNMLTKALALELAPYRIRANGICPGIIDTPMFRASYESADDPRAALEQIKSRFAIKEVGRPIDIAYAALFLSCDESAHVTGSILAVDGGRAFH